MRKPPRGPIISQPATLANSAHLGLKATGHSVLPSQQSQSSQFEANGIPLATIGQNSLKMTIIQA